MPTIGSAEWKLKNSSRLSPTTKFKVITIDIFNVVAELQRREILDQLALNGYSFSGLRVIRLQKIAGLKQEMRKDSNKMQKITPHFWYDKEAREAAEFYVTAFSENSKIKDVTTIHDTPSGSADIVTFDIWGQEFMAISAGPFFKINPSISFHVKCKTVQDVDKMWEKLSPGGTALMELGEYPFSQRFGWIEDKYGVSWQIIYAGDDLQQRITPALLFTQDACGKAEEAVNFYASIFPDSQAQVLARYEKGEEPEQEGTVKYAQLLLAGQEFVAMESARSHNFTFNEAVSLIINCQDQDEIDYFWERLSAVPEAEQCGWVKDKFGVSWQIVPANMGELMSVNLEKITPVMLQMKKIIIADLIRAGEEL